MFTIKFYSGDGCRQRILSAESFTILRGSVPGTPDDGGAEITLHQKNHSDDTRCDIRHPLPGDNSCDGPPVYQKAIIENAAGKTTEIISLSPMTTTQVAA